MQPHEIHIRHRQDGLRDEAERRRLAATAEGSRVARPDPVADGAGKPLRLGQRWAERLASIRLPGRRLSRIQLGAARQR
jgi:hypothetical protein